jgi:hypothetical protein
MTNECPNAEWQTFVGASLHGPALPFHSSFRHSSFVIRVFPPIDAGAPQALY